MAKRPEAVSLTEYEDHQRTLGCVHIAGIDEAGRGPLAGPVTAACVILPHDFEHGEINDSKQLSPACREREFMRLTSNPDVRIGIGIADHGEIDRINIYQATVLAMRRAILEIGDPIDAILLDGKPVRNLSHHTQQAIVKGDAKSISIAAASIIAKVTRDRIMVEYDRAYPVYGFAGHKGYAASKHLDAIAMHGPCPIHRLSFAPFKTGAQSNEIVVSQLILTMG